MIANYHTHTYRCGHADGHEKEDDRNYPDDRFWKLAGEEGNEVILGSDAHRPQDVLDPASIERAFRLADRYSLQIIDTVTFKHPWIEENR